MALRNSQSDYKVGLSAITKYFKPDLPKTVTLCFYQSILRLTVARKGIHKMVETSASITWNLRTVLKGPNAVNN